MKKLLLLLLLITTSCKVIKPVQNINHEPKHVMIVTAMTVADTTSIPPFYMYQLTDTNRNDFTMYTNKKYTLYDTIYLKK